MNIHSKTEWKVKIGESTDSITKRKYYRNNNSLFLD